MLQARPLYDTEADARYFVEPLGWRRLQKAVENRFNVAVFAPSGGGKTTALRQLQRRLRADGVPTAYIDASQADDVGQLVAAVEHEVAGRPGASESLRDERASTAAPPGATSVRLVQRVRALAELPSSVILVDAAHAASIANVLFGRLRDELWHLDHRWVVAAEDTERSILLAPPADAFFDQIVVLETSSDEIAAILRRRAPDLDDRTLRRIATGTRAPRAALQAARDMKTDEGRDPLGAALWRQQRSAELGRPHSMAMAELEALGGASASDSELLERLGWTRARASQILGELAGEGLVVASDERREPGRRPRRVFRPADPPRGAAIASEGTELPVVEP